MIAAIIVAVVAVSFLLVVTSRGKEPGQVTENVSKSVEFKLFDQALKEKGVVTSEVTLPLDENEACQVAKDAAQVYGLKNFECDDFYFKEQDAEINVIDETGQVLQQFLS